MKTDEDLLDDDADDEGWPDAMSRDFAMAVDATMVKTFRSEHAEAVREFKALEARFLERADCNEMHAREIRQSIAGLLLRQAAEKKQPFEVCKERWDEMVDVEFLNMEHECTLSWYFAECCRQHGKTEMGLAVLDPLIAELGGLLAEAVRKGEPADFYRSELEKLGKLRGKLETPGTSGVEKKC